MKSAASALERHAPYVECNVPLAGFTSLGIGGPAEFYAEPESEEQVRTLREICCDHGVPIRVMGAGTNLLIDDRGVDGLVIRTCRMIRVNRDGCRVRAGVGRKLHSLIPMTARWGLGGMGELAGIPGTVGGALAMNAGTRYGCIGPMVQSVTGVDARGCTRTLDASLLKLDYRSSALGQMIVCEVTLSLSDLPSSETTGRVKELLAERKAAQPTNERTAGCTFKKPPGDSAGRMIDAAGMKGQGCGGAQVSQRHANFIINRGDATAADVLILMERVKRSVHDKFGVMLEPEIRIWQRPGEGKGHEC